MIEEAAPESSHYEFIVDTGHYAGNFERQMTAYCTGHVGDCEVGYKEADQFFTDTKEKVNFEDIILQRPDEHGCFRPCSISATPNRVNNGMGVCSDADSDEGWPAYESVAMFFNENPNNYLPMLCERASEFAHQNLIPVISFRVVKVTTTTERDELMVISDITRESPQ